VQTPTRPLLELDGFSLRRLAAPDIPFVLDLHRQGGNRLLVDLPQDGQAAMTFLQELEKQPWQMMMVASSEGKPVGVHANGLTNLVSLNTYVLAMYSDASRATIPLALYTRQIFWAFPLQRMYVQFPLLEETESYRDLYRSAGFREEGIMKKHQAIAGRRHDVAVYGLLREDFDQWWATHDPRLAL
jgi:hypothetical protein